ncbi:hypothetical protein LINPERPRIM_LOCUS32607 [Linum perenne]
MPRNKSLTIQILDLNNETASINITTTTTTSTHPHAFHHDNDDVVLSANKFWPMKLFHRFRKILVRLLFSSTTPSSYRDHDQHYSAAEVDPPKTSCSSSMYNYSTQLHYSEAVADCIEFLNKSSSSTPATTISTSTSTTHDDHDGSGFDQRHWL